MLHCRHPDPEVLAALVKVTPDPLRAPQREPCMYAWTLARQSDAGDEHDGAWMTDSVQVGFESLVLSYFTCQQRQLYVKRTSSASCAPAAITASAPSAGHG